MNQVEIDLGRVYDKLSPQMVTRGKRILANQAMADMNQFVPAKSNVLRLSVTIGIDGSNIYYNTPYARRHFYAPGDWNYTTPGTGPRWDEKAKGIYMSDWEKAFLGGAQL